MLIRIRTIASLLGFMTLVSCSTTNQTAQSEPYVYTIPDAQKFPEYQEPASIEPSQPESEVQITETEAEHAPESTPTSSKNLDNLWVQQQSPVNYTILIAQDTSAAHVAMALHQAPKNARMAEVKAQNHGAANYMGVYGNYSTYDAAQQALNNLPEQMQSSATIKPWSDIQRNILE